MKKTSNAHNLYDSASSLTARPRAFVSDLDIGDYDLDLHDAADSVVDFAGDVADRAGDVAALAAVESVRGARSLSRTIQRNPEVSIAIIAAVVALIAYLSVRKSSDDTRRV
ncbi:hypothetical protein [Ilumatobacter sp.]|uniref:hypothetical protein n=1 Tax=Ilumatobacter sp. TaxID=1967498 RepID=UPI003B52E2BF